MPFDLEVVADWSYHEEFASVGAYYYFCFVEPGVGCEISGFRQLFYFLVGFEGIVLYFEEFEDISACAADEVGLGGADGDGLGALHAEVADGKASAPADIEKHELVVRFCGHAAGVLGLGGGEGDDFEGGLLVGLREFEMLDFGIPVLEPIEVEEEEVLIFNFLADGDVVPGGGDGDALDGLDIVGELDELHAFGLELLLDDGLPDGVNYFHLAVLLDDADLVLGLEQEVGAEGVVQVQVDLLLGLLHLNIESCIITNRVYRLFLLFAIFHEKEPANPALLLHRQGPPHVLLPPVPPKN